MMDYKDQYVLCDDMDEARELYEKLINKDEVYSANITEVVASTDYAHIAIIVAWMEQGES